MLGFNWGGSWTDKVRLQAVEKAKGYRVISVNNVAEVQGDLYNYHVEVDYGKRGALVTALKDLQEKFYIAEGALE